MADRYSKLFTLTKDLYAGGSPVVITAGALLFDNKTNQVLAQLKLRNIGRKAVKGITVKIAPFDTAGRLLGEPVLFQYLDFVLERDQEFGQKLPIILPNNATRSFSASVVEVAFADNDIWGCSQDIWKPLVITAAQGNWTTDHEKENKNLGDTNLNKGHAKTVKTHNSKKTLITIIALAVIACILAMVAICEYRIAKAERLYAQGEYWKAYRQIDGIPVLGREKLIRIRTAYFVGWDYESYLVTKRIRLTGSSWYNKDAYQEAFFDLTFGLHGALSHINREPCELNDIELDEYQKFADLYYSELSSMFHMSKSEANKLMAQFDKSKNVDEDKKIANEWLDKNFFD